MDIAEQLRGGYLRYGKARVSNDGYKVDLKNFMARCESNYRRLYRVFPDMATDSARRLGLSGWSGREVVLSIVERTPYTTLLSIEERGRLGSGSDAFGSEATDLQRTAFKSQSGWSHPPVLMVRMYHDARLAEVVSCDGLRSARSKNSYPNKRMLQRDEKAQWNRFLEEWLTVCIARGHVTDSTPVLLGGDV